MKRHLPALAGEFTCHSEVIQMRSANYFTSSLPEEPARMRSDSCQGTWPPLPLTNTAATALPVQRAGQSPGQIFKGKMETSHYSQAHHCSRAEGTATGESGLLPRRGCVVTLHKWSQRAFALLSRALGESLVEVYPHGWSHTDCNKEPVA